MLRESGATTRTGEGTLAACTTVTTFGLPEAPDAVTVMLAVRWALSGLVSTETLIVPELVPLVPEVMWAQLLPEVTEAVQPMDPVPALDTSKVVGPPV